MRTIVIFIFSFLICSSLLSQNIKPAEISYFEYGACDGKLKVNQSERLSSFFKTYSGINKNRDGIWGYRIRIFSDVGSNARKKANETKVRFNTEYPRIKAYLIYNNPNFEVHCGNFRTRYEAMGLLNKIKHSYPGSFIVYGIIEYPSFPRISSTETQEE